MRSTAEQTRNSTSSNADSTRESTVLTSTTTLHVRESTALNTTSINNFVELTLQMTSQVILESLEGKKLLARALLDPGASMSFVTERVVQSLQLKKDSHKLTITGAQGVSTGNSSHSG